MSSHNFPAHSSKCNCKQVSFLTTRYSLRANITMLVDVQSYLLEIHRLFKRAWKSLQHLTTSHSKRNNCPIRHKIRALSRYNCSTDIISSFQKAPYPQNDYQSGTLFEKKLQKGKKYTFSVYMGATIFQSSRSHLEIIGVRNMTRRKFDTEFSLILCAAVQSLLAMATWHRQLYTPASLFQFFLESPKPSSLAPEHIQAPTQWASGYFPGVKRPEREFDHPRSFFAQV